MHNFQLNGQVVDWALFAVIDEARDLHSSLMLNGYPSCFLCLSCSSFSKHPRCLLRVVVSRSTTHSRERLSCLFSHISAMILWGSSPKHSCPYPKAIVAFSCSVLLGVSSAWSHHVEARSPTTVSRQIQLFRLVSSSFFSMVSCELSILQKGV